MSLTYRLLARHGWKKVQPDTKHPKSDTVLQKGFKNSFRSGGNRLPEKLRLPSATFNVSG
jgi:hypothetical protein